MKKLYAITAFCLLINYTSFSQTISSNAPLCGNANLTLELSATGGTTYAWKGPNSFTSTQQKPNIKNVNWKNRGVYTVTIDNKTTLTTDVNIKDPVAFTVPKEISVCEGGTLLIEPKSGRLTDSTEVADFFKFLILNPKYNDANLSGIFENMNADKVGNYEVYGHSDSKGCGISKYVNVKLNTSSNCKNIQIEDLAMVKMCYGQNIVVPFTTRGNFLQGTKFKVYIVSMFNPSSDDFNKPLMIVDKSPITINIDKYFDQTIAIVMIADDTEKTTTISSYKYFYSKYDYRNNFINAIQTCDSSKLSVNYPNDINSLQWYLDGNVINGANKNDFIAKKSGTYSFKFKGDIARDEIDKTCLYESKPVKIELGKIEKPFAYVSNDIELCVGKPATLSVSSKANTNYRWKKDGNFIANATKDSYQTLQEGKYQIEAKEGTCTAVSDTVVLKKREKLPNIYFNIYSNTPIQSDKDIYTLCNNQEFYFVSDSITFAKHQLFKNLELIKETPNRNDFNFNPLKGEGVYFLKVIYGNCEAISRQITVKYDKKVKGYSFNDKDQECSGSTVKLSLSANLSTAKPEKGNVYKDGKIFQDWTINTSSYQDYYYEVYGLKINESGNYYALGKVILADKSECNIVTDTVRIIFSNKINDISFQYDPKIQAVPIITCKDTAIINIYRYAGVKGREIAYKWTRDGVVLKQDSSNVLKTTSAGLYQLETTYKGGCSVISLPHKVEIGKLQVDFTHALNESICDGNIYYLEPTLNEISVGDIWDFYKNGQLLTNNVKNIYTIHLTQSGIYKLKVTNGKCEGTSPDFTLKVDKIPTSITPSDSVTFCDGKTVELKTSTEAGLSYIWERNGSVISQANQANYTANADGLYKATLLRGTCWGTTPSVKLKTLANIIPTATLTGDKKIDYDTETKLSINLTSHAPWTFKLSDGKEYTATKSPFEVSVKPMSTTTYSVSEIKNICGTGTVSGTAKIEIIILSAEEEKELKVEVFPMPSSEICHWKIETPQATNASVLMYDVLGVTQYSQASSARTQTHEGTIDLTNIKAGTYFLKLQAGEKSVVRKVVKF